MSSVQEARKPQDKINPLLGLPAMRQLIGMPFWVRAALAALMTDIKVWAEAKAQHCWRKRKAPLASYYFVCGVYAAHIGRALRRGLPKDVPTEGMLGYLDVSTGHLKESTRALLDARDCITGMTVAPYDYGVFVSVPEEEYEPEELPGDLKTVLRYARRAGAVIVRFDADGACHDLPVFDGDELADDGPTTSLTH